MGRAGTSRTRTWLAAVVAALAAVAVLLARNVELGPRDPTPIDARTARAELPVLDAHEAAARIGDRALVCGRVASATYAAAIGGRPTYLNFGRPYPNQDFTVVIWGRHRAKFGRPEAYYLDREICVAGRIQAHEGTPRIEATEPIQIEACRSGRC